MAAPVDPTLRWARITGFLSAAVVARQASTSGTAGSLQRRLAAGDYQRACDQIVCELEALGAAGTLVRIGNFLGRGGAL